MSDHLPNMFFPTPLGQSKHCRRNLLTTAGSLQIPETGVVQAIVI